MHCLSWNICSNQHQCSEVLIVKILLDLRLRVVTAIYSE